MDDIFNNKQSTSTVKLNGLGNGLDLDLDKPKLVDPFAKIHQQIEEDRRKRAALNQQFDPSYMEFHTVDPVDTGNISFNPTDMKFNN